MNDSLHIKLVKKDPYKVFRADIKSDEHVQTLCKFLTKHKDKTLEIIINGKNFKFTSVVGRKSFVIGFKCAMATVEPYLKKFFKELEAKLNNALSERDKAKQEFTAAKTASDTKNTVSCLRIAAHRDQVAELEENCKHLKEQVVCLRKKLEDANHKWHT
jgi:hypothetical protein